MALVLLWFAAAAVIPRWWGQRVGNVVDGSLTVGALYGLFIGFVFTVAPLLLLLVVIRWRTSDRTWLGWLGWILLVLLLAAPNLMTLSIVLGNQRRRPRRRPHARRRRTRLPPLEPDRRDPRRPRRVRHDVPRPLATSVASTRGRAA